MSCGLTVAAGVDVREHDRNAKRPREVLIVPYGPERLPEPENARGVVEHIGVRRGGGNHERRIPPPQLKQEHHSPTPRCKATDVMARDRAEDGVGSDCCAGARGHGIEREGGRWGGGRAGSAGQKTDARHDDREQRAN